MQAILLCNRPVVAVTTGDVLTLEEENRLFNPDKLAMLDVCRQPSFLVSCCTGPKLFVGRRDSNLCVHIHRRC